MSDVTRSDRVPPSSPDASYALLVLDDDSAAIRRFHGAAELGARLGCSGSAQPSVAAFTDLRRRLAGVRDDELLVIDLRSESHGFVNGAAVSWYAEMNWGTAGLSDEEVLALERLRLRLLAGATRVRVGNVEAVKRGQPLAAVEWLPHTVQHEPQAFGLSERQYARIPVVDHCAPSDGAVDRFIDLVRRVRSRPARTHLHVHCRGGKGRTATFLALLDMLHHAAQLPLQAILQRQAQLCDYDLRGQPEPASRKAPFIAARRAFLEQFHAYARGNPLDGGARWSDWVAARAAGMPAT